MVLHKRSASMASVGWLKCCFTSTETVGLLGTEVQDVHLDFHTAPDLCVASLYCSDYTVIVTLTATESLFGFCADLVSSEKIFIMKSLNLSHKSIAIGKSKYSNQTNFGVVFHQQVLLRKL